VSKEHLEERQENPSGAVKCIGESAVVRAGRSAPRKIVDSSNRKRRHQESFKDAGLGQGKGNFNRNVTQGPSNFQVED